MFRRNRLSREVRDFRSHYDITVDSRTIDWKYRGRSIIVSIIVLYSRRTRHIMACIITPCHEARGICVAFVEGIDPIQDRIRGGDK
jgi:hypothetical protein